MRILKETFQTIRNKVTKFEPQLIQKEQERAMPIESNFLEQSATTVFDRSIIAKDPRHLDNHLSASKAEIKLFEASPKLR